MVRRLLAQRVVLDAKVSPPLGLPHRLGGVEATEWSGGGRSQGEWVGAGAEWEEKDEGDERGERATGGGLSGSCGPVKWVGVENRSRRVEEGGGR